MKSYKYFCAGLLAFVSVFSVFSQEALKSTEEEYYDFLALQGITKRPYLNYRTLSDSDWSLIGRDAGEEENEVADKNIDASHVWQNNYLGKRRFINGNKKLAWKIYGPEWYNSFNTAAPYGQNDGALWQGRGYNTSLTGGARFEAYGVEMTLKPQLSFSQNMAFDLMASNYDSKYGYFWGYDPNIGIDAPQRFGDKPFFMFDWGDTEIRYTWKTLTVGFGTQNIWIGPAYLNPVLHSNNAPSYPKLDLGLRRTSIHIPKVGWYVGDVEARIWTGYLSESKYFDNDSSNDHNMIHGFTFAYSAPYIGLTLFANRICLVKWKPQNIKYIIPLESNTHIGETDAGEDQKMSFGFDWVYPNAGIELYAEVGIDDFFSGGFIKGLSRYPFDSMVSTFGIKKTVNLPFAPQFKGEIIFEYSDFDEPRNRISSKSKYAFNMHYQIKQGLTNKGQPLASPLGNGGNSQTLKFILYYPKGISSLTIARSNPDNTFMYWRVANKNGWYKADLTIIAASTYFVTPALSVFGALGWDWKINPYYDIKTDVENMHNFILQTGLKFNI
ncbi:capsule assembly Wzi family protein [Treponema socranskii]|uniref:capsule assembly Wzi family protein n=1 Tax=Treponema socranskii TaxID=53419 RepID=UPI003D8D20B7